MGNSSNNNKEDNTSTGQYGVVRVRLVLDENDEDLVRPELYNPSTGKWETVNDDLIGYIADHSIVLTTGFFENGIQGTQAIRLGDITPELEKYIVEWVREDEIPKEPFLVNENTEFRIIKAK